MSDDSSAPRSTPAASPRSWSRLSRFAAAHAGGYETIAVSPFLVRDAGLGAAGLRARVT